MHHVWHPPIHLVGSRLREGGECCSDRFWCRVPKSPNASTYVFMCVCIVRISSPWFPSIVCTCIHLNMCVLWFGVTLYILAVVRRLFRRSVVMAAGRTPPHYVRHRFLCTEDAEPGMTLGCRVWCCGAPSGEVCGRLSGTVPCWVQASGATFSGIYIYVYACVCRLY